MIAPFVERQITDSLVDGGISPQKHRDWNVATESQHEYGRRNRRFSGLIGPSWGKPMLDERIGPLASSQIHA